MHDIEVHAWASRMSSRTLCRRLFEMIDAPFNHVEPPTANEVNRLRSERFENRRAINARVGFHSPPLLRHISAKCGGRHLEKRFKISRLRVPY